MATNLDLKFPAIDDLRKRAKRRMPRFAFEYLDSATGQELGVKYNRDALDAIRFMPGILSGELSYDLSHEFMGRKYDYPFGIAPVGMSGVIWPGAETILASGAQRNNIPYCLSSVAAADPEDLAPHIGDNGWFQLYPPADPAIRKDMLARVQAAGFSKLILTVDVPAESRRERQRRALISMPPKMTPSIAWSILTHPHWALAMARAGSPRMKFPESYVDPSSTDPFVHAGRIIRGYPDWQYLADLRAEWQGDLIIKGVLNPEDAVKLLDSGADAIWISNHTGRQFEAAPASIDQLPKIRDAVGDAVPLIVDSGVSGGLDLMRCLALGADFVFLGKAFHYAVAAFTDTGVDHLVNLLQADLIANMSQTGAQTYAELPEKLYKV